MPALQRAGMVIGLRRDAPFALALLLRRFTAALLHIPRRSLLSVADC